MILKIIIISIILLVGGYFFADEISKLFPQTTKVVQSIKDDATIIQKNVTDDISKKASNSINEVTDKIDDIKNSSKTILSEEIEKNNPIPKISQGISETVTNSTSAITKILPKP